MFNQNEIAHAMGFRELEDDSGAVRRRMRELCRTPVGTEEQEWDPDGAPPDRWRRERSGRDDA